MHQKVTYNQYYPTQKQFANAILRFFGETIPSQWKVFRDQASDNFRVITHEKVRVLGYERYKLQNIVYCFAFYAGRTTPVAPAAI